MYDCVIIGAGSSGLTAAIYLLRSNLKVAIVEESMPGGQVANTAHIENYPGFESIDGVDLATKMYMQATNLGVEYFGEKALSIDKEGNIFKVALSDQTLEAKTVIVASGMKHRKLGLENEEAFSGRGISWCAICDGSLYKGKDVAVVGGGNSAVEESIYLSGLVNKVYVIHRRNEFRAEKKISEKLRSLPNVEIIFNDEISKLNGKDSLENITLKSGRELNVDCLFEYVGFLPNSELVTKYNVTDESGFIVVDENQETSVKGLFASGDVVVKTIRQIVTAVSEGAVAALHAAKYCR